MLTLGHIKYSNCIPVHGRFLECGPPSDVEMIHGVPGELNHMLESGQIDVAPASCIEYPRHADRYRILPDLSISARGPVRTIQLLSRTDMDEMRDGIRLAIPTASATSVVLLKIIMRQHLGIRPDYFWFEQEAADGIPESATAALFIGDVARRELVRKPAGGRMHAYDLGSAWFDWTGLPFVFALWQASAGRDRDEELRSLARELVRSREWSHERLPQLADRHAASFGWSAGELLDYWRSLEYGWSDDLAAGLGEFYRRAADLGEIPAAVEPVFLKDR